MGEKMNRDELIGPLNDKNEIWDVIIIGGGATGVGTAIDGASRGYKVLLFEQSDFGKGTSSRSTKLVHGGVRYLQQGNISLVLEALKERGILSRNAPHLVKNLPFVVPSYDWWEGPFYGIGLKLYDLLAGKEGFGDSKILSKEKTLSLIPTIETEGLKGGVIYYDGQFDDARLIMNMVQTAHEQGALILNYIKVTGFMKKDSCISGVIARDEETGQEYQIKGRVVVNATGAFSDDVRGLDDSAAKPIIAPSQGVHLVLDKSFLPGETAIMIPQTDDGRVLFAIPWHDRVVVGTTDTPVTKVLTEPIPLAEEIDFILSHAARYLTKDPNRSDVLSAFAGLRPLVRQGDVKNTAEISRDHTLHISPSGLLTIAGGKWTTYRKMAEDTIDQAIILAGLDHELSATENLNIHGYHKNAEVFGDLSIYGSDAPQINKLFDENKVYHQLIHPDKKSRIGEIIWSVRKEMARTVEDFLARRTRHLLLDAKVTLEMAPVVAEWMAKELKRSRSWQKSQILDYNKIAQNYIP
jgi:glycerol-3-phosphate dehydrogenase